MRRRLMITKWRYLVMNVETHNIDLTNVQNKLNQAGSNGWELVSYLGGIFIFKRLK